MGPVAALKHLSSLLQGRFDLNPMRQSCSRQWHSDFQQPLVEFCSNLLDIRTLRESHRPLEIAVGKFAVQVARLLRCLTALPGTANRSVLPSTSTLTLRAS